MLFQKICRRKIAHFFRNSIEVPMNMVKCKYKCKFRIPLVTPVDIKNANKINNKFETAN